MFAGSGAGGGSGARLLSGASRPGLRLALRVRHAPRLYWQRVLLRRLHGTATRYLRFTVRLQRTCVSRYGYMVLVFHGTAAKYLCFTVRLQRICASRYWYAEIAGTSRKEHYIVWVHHGTAKVYRYFTVRVHHGTSTVYRYFTVSKYISVFPITNSKYISVFPITNSKYISVFG